MASAKSVIRVKGLKELEDALLELPKATQGNVLKRAAVAAAADFAEHAQALAPHGRTGRLKTEIKVAKPRIINPGTAAGSRNEGMLTRISPPGRAGCSKIVTR